MIVIVCLDEQNGMMFNHRRQSRDRLVIEDILRMCKGESIYLNEYSYSLFQDMGAEQIRVENDFLKKAGQGEYCFVEDQKLSAYEEKIEKLIIYKWNRRYPSDLYFDLSLVTDWRMTVTSEFKGFSHEKITKEIYIRA